LDGTRLRMGTLTYARRRTGDARRAVAVGTWMTSIAPARAGGVPAWRVARSWTSASGATRSWTEAETTFVAADDLQPISRTVQITPYLRYDRLTISQRLVGDSVVGTMAASERQGARVVRRAIARVLPAAERPYLMESILPVLFGAVRLDREWRGVVGVLGWAVVPDDVLQLAELEVRGTATVSVPAGTFECWALTSVTPGRRLTLWVRRSDGVAVRWQFTSSQGGAADETVLARESPDRDRGARPAIEDRLR
jgi:hypothetical protein